MERFSEVHYAPFGKNGGQTQTLIADEADITAEDVTDWVGHIDLLLVKNEGSERHAAVIDHKTARLPETAWSAYAARHTGQLEAYREILEALGHTRVDMWLHLPFSDGILRWEPEHEPRLPARPLVQADLPFD